MFSIVTCANPDSRTEVIDVFINLAQLLLKLQNYTSFMAVMGALCSPPVIRLKKTFTLMRPRSLKRLREMANIVAPTDNFAAFRATVAERNPKEPMIPFIGLLIADICTCEAEMNTYTVEGTILMGKQIRLFELYEELTMVKDESRYERFLSHSSRLQVLQLTGDAMACGKDHQHRIK